MIKEYAASDGHTFELLPEQQQHLILTEAEQRWIKENRQVKVGGDPTWAPIDFVEQQQHRGISADYLELIAKQTGLQFQFVPYNDWGSVLTAAKNNNIDLITALSRTTFRETFLDLSIPYLDYSLALATTKFGHFTHPDHFNNKPIGVVKGYFAESILLTHYPDVGIVHVASAKEGVAMLAAEKIDAYFDNLAVISYHTRQAGLTHLNTSIFNEHSSVLHIVKGQPELVSIINKALAAISKEEKQLIDNRWMSLSTGQAVVDFVQHYPVDLVLMDIRMPVMDGYQAAQKIKALYPDLPIVALTASVMENEHSQEQLHYFDAYYCANLATGY